MVDDVETLATSIVRRRVNYWPSLPWVDCVRILIEIRFTDHLVKQALKRATRGRRIPSKLVSWVLREGFCLDTKRVTVKFAVHAQAYLVGALGSAVGYFPKRDRRVHNRLCASSVFSIRV